MERAVVRSNVCLFSAIMKGIGKEKGDSMDFDFSNLAGWACPVAVLVLVLHLIHLVGEGNARRGVRTRRPTELSGRTVSRKRYL